MTRRVVIVLVAGLAVVMSVGSLVLAAIPRVVPLPDTYSFRWMQTLLLVSFDLTGAAIALRRPGNAVGWIFLGSGAFGGLLQLGDEYATYALFERGGALGGGAWAAWVASWSLPLAVGPISSYLFLVFPDGRPPSPRWRPVGRATIGVIVVWTAAAALLPGQLNQFVAIPNPLWPDSTGGPPGQTPFGRAITVVSVLVAALCAAAMVQRFRRSSGVECQQLKWMAYAAAIVAIGVLLVPVATGERKLLQVVQMSTLLLIPAAAGIAILRHRLYDVDLLIKRTVVYGSLSAILAAVYVAAVVLSEALLRPFTGASQVSVAGSTLLVAALFQPVRQRVQGLVDRGFYRARYDAGRTLDEFSVRLGDEVDLDTVGAELAEAVGTTLRPAHVSLWLRAGARNDSRTAGG